MMTKYLLVIILTLIWRSTIPHPLLIQSHS